MLALSRSSSLADKKCSKIESKQRSHANPDRAMLTTADFEETAPPKQSIAHNINKAEADTPANKRNDQHRVYKTEKGSERQRYCMRVLQETKQNND